MATSLNETELNRDCVLKSRTCPNPRPPALDGRRAAAAEALARDFWLGWGTEFEAADDPWDFESSSAA